MSIAYRYTGRRGREDEFYPGIPARSLTEDDYDALDTDQKRLVREGGLYSAVEAEPAAKPAAKADARKDGE
jgi:hypothetical protein